MSNITYRLVKGQELTFAEIDENFSSLDSDIRGNRRYFDSTLEQFGLGRDSDFLAVLAERDSDAAAIILLTLAHHDSDIADLNAAMDSEHAWNVSEHSGLSDRLDSEHTWNVVSHNNLQDNIDAEVLTAGSGIAIDASKTILNTMPDQTVVIEGSGATSVTGSYPNFVITSTDTNNNTTYTAGSGMTLSGTQFINAAPDQVVAITGTGATTVTGTYPNFTVNSTDNNTTYTAGSGMTLSGTQFINAAPDQTVAITGTGATSVTGTYPNFTVSSTDNNTTYTAGNGLTLSGTQFLMSGSYTGTFTATGDVVAYSDMALKSEVTAIDEALDKLMSITGYPYNTKGSDRRHSGVMAQAVEEVLPEVVHTSEDGTKGVAYGNMMGLVIEAIRELKTQVDELKGR